jgi:hypothetical protein
MYMGQLTTRDGGGERRRRAVLMLALPGADPGPNRELLYLKYRLPSPSILQSRLPWEGFRVGVRLVGFYKAMSDGGWLGYEYSWNI